jgi:hypothetical protein
MIKIKIIILTLLLCANFINAQILTVEQTIQEQDQWCWAAVSSCVLKYYENNISQCSIAEYTRTVATWHNFGTTDCCVNPGLGCNYWNYNWGYTGSIQDILQHWSVNNFGVASSLSLTTVRNELTAGRPFIPRWGWTTGGGHFIVGHGISMTDSMMYYMDPWFGQGLKIAKYSWVVSGSNHIWTSTNQITTNPVPVELNSFTATANNNDVILNWSTATELNNYGFEIQRKAFDGDFATVAFVKGQGTTTQQNQYSFADKNLEEGKYSYRLKQVDFSGTFEYSKAIEVDVITIAFYSLEQNYPNPFNPTTTIGFGIPEKGNVRLSVLNILGEEIRVLLNEDKEAGYHSIDFNGSDLPSGVYFYRIQSGNFIDTKKMVLLK